MTPRTGAESSASHSSPSCHPSQHSPSFASSTSASSSGSRSAQGILRGLHYQTKHTQGKLVRVVAGEVFDVAVDMRRASPTFGHWVGVTLSAVNRRMLWVPPGFAHGFYVTSAEGAEFLYKCTDYYDPAHEVSVRWDDPTLGIEWPLVEGRAPALSAKDAAGVEFGVAPAF